MHSTFLLTAASNCDSGNRRDKIVSAMNVDIAFNFYVFYNGNTGTIIQQVFDTKEL